MENTPSQNGPLEKVSSGGQPVVDSDQLRGSDDVLQGRAEHSQQRLSEFREFQRAINQRKDEAGVEAAIQDAERSLELFQDCPEAHVQCLLWNSHLCALLPNNEGKVLDLLDRAAECVRTSGIIASDSAIDFSEDYLTYHRMVGKMDDAVPYLESYLRELQSTDKTHDDRVRMMRVRLGTHLLQQDMYEEAEGILLRALNNGSADDSVSALAKLRAGKCYRFQNSDDLALPLLTGARDFFLQNHTEAPDQQQAVAFGVEAALAVVSIEVQRQSHSGNRNVDDFTRRLDVLGIAAERYLPAGSEELSQIAFHRLELKVLGGAVSSIAPALRELMEFETQQQREGDAVYSSAALLYGKIVSDVATCVHSYQTKLYESNDIDPSVRVPEGNTISLQSVWNLLSDLHVAPSFRGILPATSMVERIELQVMFDAFDRVIADAVTQVKENCSKLSAAQNQAVPRQALTQLQNLYEFLGRDNEAQVVADQIDALKDGH